mgnify:CR=1 FL=1
MCGDSCLIPQLVGRTGKVRHRPSFDVRKSTSGEGLRPDLLKMRLSPSVVSRYLFEAANLLHLLLELLEDSITDLLKLADDQRGIGDGNKLLVGG